MISSYALIAHGKHNPYLVTPLPEHMLYPISQKCRGGLDLDYNALLIGESFTIDHMVYEDVVTSKKEYLKPMQNSLRRLFEDGLLQIVDYSSFFKENSEKIINITQMLLLEPTAWLCLAQEQWKTLRGELLEFQTEHGSDRMFSINTSNMGIESWLCKSRQHNNRKLRNNLYLLFEGKKTIDTVSIDDVRGSLEYIVSQIVMSELVSFKIDAPILDWDDSKGMYDKLLSLRWGEHQDDALLRRESNRLFNIALPSLKPNNIEGVIRFIRDNKAVASLRETLFRVIETGGEIDSEWVAEFQRELLRSDIAKRKKSSTIQLLGTIAGLFAPSFVAGAAIATTTYFVDKALMKDDTKYKWYYALLKEG